MNIEKKYELVLEAYNNAYAKYSNFQVGAVVITKDGKYFLGSNIENASFGLTNCAERSALFSLISQGYNPKDVVEIIIIADTKKPVSPCGACRQVMTELLNPECIVTMFNLNQDVLSVKVNDLIPFAFDEGDLHE